MKSDEIPIVDTWGRRLSWEAQRLMAKRMPELQWLRELAPLLDRITSLPAPAQDRFRRVESTGSQQAKRLNIKPSIEDESLPLPPAVRERLAPSGSRLEGVHVHTGSKADEIAREHKADAVTIDHGIYFREGRYQPQSRAGLALLAHELEHILAALHPNAAWRRATIGGVQDEEEQALIREHQVLEAPKFTDNLVPPQLAQPIIPAKSVAKPLQRPMTAEATRDSGTQMPALEGGSTNKDTLRRELYRDLLSQIRSDLERGA